MRYLLVIMLLFATLAQPVHADEDACDMLFVQDAKAMVFDGNRLILKGANPNIIFFCDRPVRTAGHLNRDAFMKLVSEGEDSFASNPPNAAISIFGATNEVTEVVVVLPKRPVVSGDDLIFTVKVLEGKLPAKGGAVVMFIDSIGRPVSPTSAAGVHRRHERRD
jgi:hypothetical protein